MTESESGASPKSLKLFTVIWLALPLLLAGCCVSDDADCTPQQLADKQAQNSSIPQLVAVQDNVRVYRVWTREPYAYSHWTYFTTPCGDVSSQVEFSSGKARHQIPVNVNGTGCR